MALIKFSAPQMRLLFEGGAYVKIGRDKERKNAENRLLAQVTGKRKREVWLIEPAKCTAFTTELCIARILDREPNGRVVIFYHFELKNIAFDEKKLPMLFKSCFVVFF